MFYSFTILTLHHGEIKSGISRGWRETGERMACFWADCTNPTPQQERQNVKKRTPCVRLLHDRVYKPGSVSDSHLSSRRVAAAIQPPPRKQPGQPCFLHGVAPDRVCSDGRFHAIGCALTAPFHPYRQSYSLSVRVAYRSLRERPLRRADCNREEGPFVPLHTTPLRRSAQERSRCSGKFPSPRSAEHRVQPSLVP